MYTNGDKRIICLRFNANRRRGKLTEILLLLNMTADEFNFLFFVFNHCHSFCVIVTERRSTTLDYVYQTKIDIFLYRHACYPGRGR